MWFKTKYFFSTKVGKNIIVYSLITFLLLLIILPIVNSIVSNLSDSIIPYKRDAYSGTQESFEKSFLNKDPSQQYGRNTVEIKSNDKMFSTIQQVSNAIGFVSYGTIHDIYKNQEKYENASFYVLDFYINNQWVNIEDESYPSRNFNIFWRSDSASLSTVFDNEFNNFADYQLVYNPNWQTVNPNDQYKGWKWESETGEGLDSMYVLKTYETDSKATLEAINWCLYNYLIYSSSALELSLSLAFEMPNDTIDIIGVASNGAPDVIFIDFLKEVIKVFGKEENTNFYIKINGSTSVGAVGEEGLVVQLVNSFEENVLTKVGYSLDLQADMTGSSAAFSNDKDVYIGFLSRQSSIEEVSKYYGVKNLTEEDMAKVFNPFVEDKIALITNKKSIDKEKHIGISQTILQAIYLTDTQYSWEMIYELESSIYEK